MALSTDQKQKIDIVISESFKCSLDSFTPQTHLKDLGDSITKMEMEMELEFAFSIDSIPDSVSEELVDIQDIYNLIDKMVNGVSITFLKVLNLIIITWFEFDL